MRAAPVAPLKRCLSINNARNAEKHEKQFQDQAQSTHMRSQQIKTFAHQCIPSRDGKYGDMCVCIYMTYT